MDHEVVFLGVGIVLGRGEPGGQEDVHTLADEAVGDPLGAKAGH